jgi:hypothetical protein
LTPLPDDCSAVRSAALVAVRSDAVPAFRSAALVAVRSDAVPAFRSAALVAFRPEAAPALCSDGASDWGSVSGFESVPWSGQSEVSVDGVPSSASSSESLNPSRPTQSRTVWVACETAPEPPVSDDGSASLSPVSAPADAEPPALELPPDDPEGSNWNLLPPQSGQPDSISLEPSGNVRSQFVH